jgi:hypothetical protein
MRLCNDELSYLHRHQFLGSGPPDFRAECRRSSVRGMPSVNLWIANQIDANKYLLRLYWSNVVNADRVIDGIS